ncbi:hypothetical protein LY78DRAFT_424087 [Colletotrichum sublineola]|nr:hypothetical protein LY78DRAFT_424087 [Colletotrichum sublineola]
MLGTLYRINRTHTTTLHLPPYLIGLIHSGSHPSSSLPSCLCPSTLSFGASLDLLLRRLPIHPHVDRSSSSSANLVFSPSLSFSHSRSVCLASFAIPPPTTTSSTSLPRFTSAKPFVHTYLPKVVYITSHTTPLYRRLPCPQSPFHQGACRVQTPIAFIAPSH